MLMLTGYFDEVGQYQDKVQRVNGIAGFIAPAEDWVKFEIDWLEYIKDKQYKDYHDRQIRRKSRERRRNALLDLLEKYNVLPMGFLVSMDSYHALPQEHKNCFGDPYYRAYVYCMRFTCSFVNEQQTLEQMRTEKVLTVFDRKKQHFRDKALEYYKEWKKKSAFANKMVEEPVFRSADFPPMYAADMLAAILKEEFERRMYNIGGSPAKSFERVYQMAERSLIYPPSDNIPFNFLQSADLNEWIRPYAEGKVK